MAPHKACRKLKVLWRCCEPSSVCTTCFLWQSQQRKTKTGSTTVFFLCTQESISTLGTLSSLYWFQLLLLRFTNCFSDLVSKAWFLFVHFIITDVSQLHTHLTSYSVYYSLSNHFSVLCLLSNFHPCLSSRSVSKHVNSFHVPLRCDVPPLRPLHK